MNRTSTKNNCLHNCDKCNKSYKRLYHLNVHYTAVHGIIIEKTQNNAPKQKIKRKKRKATKKYCIICCRTYSSIPSYKYHMKKYHDGVDINEQLIKGQEPFTWYKTKTTDHDQSDDNLRHQDKEISQELKDNKIICNLCNSRFPNKSQYKEHQKIHLKTDTSDSSEVSFMRLEMKNNGSDTNPKISYDIVCELTCNFCLSKFKSVSKHEEHERICAVNMAKNVESHRLCQSKLTNVDEMKAVELTKDIYILSKDTGKRTEAHMKALFEFQINQRKIDCEICGKGCDQLQHLEYYQWWNPS
ncbi:PR domain zinc finger protein 5-like [Sipha flava]|jgi:hypothetical protein|uniref:PR domain zinc finger protein 5-like n=1 Tax=Sipha flava TaxID=143950 RepID=A0A2S2QIQ6_9HEMI|nr:PR domain zinc finger protein 5-like [Sipha flava]XP_025405501.1 PR domain zinc finger protein 5-like [Sipha flava]XP_025405502.1 PR domain zinc finger protein 5-like [Sipha flava]